MLSGQYKSFETHTEKTDPSKIGLEKDGHPILNDFNDIIAAFNLRRNILKALLHQLNLHREHLLHTI